MNVEAALAYARRHALHALLAVVENELVLEQYDSNWTQQRAHALYSGTKSFWGVAAFAAQADGLLTLDEPVSDTISTWRADAWKARVTLRQLLNLTAGLAFGGLGPSVPSYQAALAKPLRDEPGTKFTYGGIPLQVFGAVLACKLEARRQTPQSYLATRILDPLGIAVEHWRARKDGTQPLPTGAFMSAAHWLRYGAFVLGRGAIAGMRILGRARPGRVRARLGNQRELRPGVLARRPAWRDLRERRGWSGALRAPKRTHCDRPLRGERVVQARGVLTGRCVDPRPPSGAVILKKMQPRDGR